MRVLAIAVVTVGTMLTAVVGVAGYLVVSELRELTVGAKTLSQELATLASAGIKVNGPVTAVGCSSDAIERDRETNGPCASGSLGVSVNEWPRSVGVVASVGVVGTTFVDVTGAVDANLGTRSISVDVGSVDVSADVYSMPTLDVDVDEWPEAIVLDDWPVATLDVYDYSR